MSLLTYFVLTRYERDSNRVVGYRVCFQPRPGPAVEVENGYFQIRDGACEVALIAANNLRDEMNISAADTSR